MVTEHEIEGLFAVDLAFLQDFYGVINFGSRRSTRRCSRRRHETSLVGEAQPTRRARAGRRGPAAGNGEQPDDVPTASGRPPLRTAVEELPRRAQ